MAESGEYGQAEFDINDHYVLATVGVSPIDFDGAFPILFEFRKRTDTKLMVPSIADIDTIAAFMAMISAHAQNHDKMEELQRLSGLHYIRIRQSPMFRK